MWRKKGSGIFRRYFIATTAITLFSLVVMGSASLWLVARYWSDTKQALLNENAAGIAEKTAGILSSAYPDETKTLMVSYILTSTYEAINAEVFVCNAEGLVAYCNHLQFFLSECNHRYFKLSEETMREAMSPYGLSDTSTLDGNYGSRHFIAAKPVEIDGEVVGAVFVTQETAQELQTYIEVMLRIFVFSMLAALLVSFLAIYLLNFQLTKPLSDMSKAAKQYAKGDFSNRVRYGRRVKNGDELYELVQDFNSMASALAVLETTRRSFVANVSHELKTPMTTIGGFIDGILDGTIEGDRQKHYLSIVSAEVKRLSRLVTGMLNMSKIEAGELELNPKHFNIADMILNTLLSFEQAIEKKRVEIRGLDTMDDLQVWGDADMLNQVVYNLIDNAVKFVEEGGYIAVSGAAEGERISVGIRNSGKGISAEEIGNVFERFYKVDKSRSYDVKSAGLGLYIVKSIVEMHGGQISVRSEEGEYAEFSFWLPRKRNTRWGES